jgi:maleamate amidohydrolase
MSEDAREIYAERGLGGRQQAGRRPCLVVVDLSYGFTEPDSPLGCDAAAALEANAHLLAAAREARAPVVFTRIEYDDASKVAARAFLEKIPALAILTADNRLSGIDDAIAPRPGETVLTKLYASGFFGTPLQSVLAARGADTVIVTGASTSGCVRATVVDAMQHGYRVVVPREAVADRAAGPHEAALFDIDMKYGDVVATDEAVALLSASAWTEEAVSA